MIYQTEDKLELTVEETKKLKELVLARLHVMPDDVSVSMEIKI